MDHRSGTAQVNAVAFLGILDHAIIQPLIQSGRRAVGLVTPGQKRLPSIERIPPYQVKIQRRKPKPKRKPGKMLKSPQSGGSDILDTLSMLSLPRSLWSHIPAQPLETLRSPAPVDHVLPRNRGPGLFVGAASAFVFCEVGVCDADGAAAMRVPVRRAPGRCTDEVVPASVVPAVPLTHCDVGMLERAAGAAAEERGVPIALPKSSSGPRLVEASCCVNDEAYQVALGEAWTSIRTFTTASKGRNKTYQGSNQDWASPSLWAHFHEFPGSGPAGEMSMQAWESEKDKRDTEQTAQRIDVNDELNFAAKTARLLSVPDLGFWPWLKLFVVPNINSAQHSQVRGPGMKGSHSPVQVPFQIGWSWMDREADALAKSSTHYHECCIHVYWITILEQLRRRRWPNQESLYPSRLHHWALFGLPREYYREYYVYREELFEGEIPEVLSPPCSHCGHSEVGGAVLKEGSNMCGSNLKLVVT
ncbi:hypothetical protein SODALDRAFT_361374 [Sodiomyces alkalinus F11]|uniref:Uncharacterized protein n=1 Tax=Sodiomyces alkalinus (strain CBS 110278 / VKM F-3762 / F11) TaxID=1314773 RepID=A0A3N2PT12_SODAK|nr:hypothetical protein SODALDRAFT_361374 [Sodiomyces alkalinus F11]ROT37647.1 hypothetical protein SODALDRAFT_361374 [Sodiomyces alkalinus F11]